MYFFSRLQSLAHAAQEMADGLPGGRLVRPHRPRHVGRHPGAHAALPRQAGKEKSKFLTAFLNFSSLQLFDPS